MAFGICNGCEQQVHWRAGRGCSITDVRCPKCGGTVRGANAGVPGKNLGKTIEVCAVCGRRRYIMLHPKEDYRVEWPAAGKGPEGRQEIFPAGSPCCDTHIPRPVDLKDNSKLTFRSPEWCEIENRKERFLFDAAGGKKKLYVWSPQEDVS